MNPIAATGAAAMSAPTDAAASTSSTSDATLSQVEQSLTSTILSMMETLVLSEISDINNT